MDTYKIEVTIKEADPAAVERILTRAAMQVGTLVHVGKTGASDLLDGHGDVMGRVHIRRQTPEEGH